MRAALVYACVLSILATVLIGGPQFNVRWAPIGEVHAQSAAVTGANGAPTAPQGVRLIGSDNTTDHWVGTDASGNVYTWDKSNNTPHLELNIRSNNGLSTKFVSAPIDMSLMGAWKNVRVRASGNVTLFVGIEGAATSVMDSTTTAPFPLGGCDPQGLAKGAKGVMRIVTPVGCVSTDSTLVTRAALAFPLADSLTGAPFTWPYARVIVFSNAAPASNVYLDMSGGLR